MVYITDPVDFMKSLSGKPRLRIALLKSSVSLHNVSVALRKSASFEDVYFADDSVDLAVSAYMEVPQGV